MEEVMARIEELTDAADRQVDLMEQALVLRRSLPWFAFAEKRALYRQAVTHRDAVVSALAEVDRLREGG